MQHKVLVIEDNVDILDNTCELLTLAGYEVIPASNGKEGLEKVRGAQPDLILCDIMMPELDGYGVLRAIDNIPEVKGTPFVFLTAKSERGDFRAAMDLGADDYLTKPFSGDELLRVVSARIKKSLQQRENRKESTAIADFADDDYSFEELINKISEKSIKNLRPKDIIYMEGDTPNFLYVVLSGKIKTFKTNEWGKEYITEIVNPGNIFGHLAILSDEEHRQSAMALESAEIAYIPRQSFLGMLASNPNLNGRFVRLLSDTMLGTEERLLQLAYNSARKRVAEALLFLYRQYNSKEDASFSFPVNRENLSAIAGISPESVSRNLTDFKEEKLILTENGNIRITNFKGLSGLRG